MRLINNSARGGTTTKRY